MKVKLDTGMVKTQAEGAVSDAEVGSDCQGGQEQFVDVVKEDMNVTEEDADERVGRWQMIGCFHPKG